MYFKERSPVKVISDSTMDQSRYLSHTLWQYRGSLDYTDITLVCEDGILPAHAAMLAGLFTSFGITQSIQVKEPDCVFFPDVTTTDMQQALKALYLHNNANLLRKILNRSKSKVEKEASSDGCNTASNKAKSEEESIGFLDQQDALTLKVESNSEAQSSIHIDKAKIAKVPIKQLNFQSDLNKHLYREHNKLWNCKTCGKGFATKRERLTHRMKEHSDELEACGIPTGKKAKNAHTVTKCTKNNWAILGL